MESEVEVLGSESIALVVIDDLKLANDPEFVDTGNGPIVGFLICDLWHGRGCAFFVRHPAQTNRNKGLSRAISAYGA